MREVKREGGEEKGWRRREGERAKKVGKRMAVLAGGDATSDGGLRWGG